MRDKGTGGAEGTFLTYTAEVQWFDVDIATFDDHHHSAMVWVVEHSRLTTSTSMTSRTNNEALSTNAVNGSHTSSCTSTV